MKIWRDTTQMPPMIAPIKVPFRLLIKSRGEEEEPPCLSTHTKLPTVLLHSWFGPHLLGLSSHSFLSIIQLLITKKRRKEE